MGKYTGLKIATIYGQGIEGCGVTRTSVELELWAEKTGAIIHTYALNYKTYTRTDAHDFKNLSYFGDNSKRKNSHIPGIRETGEKINNEYDIVMFMNYPNAKTARSVSKSFYYDFFEVIQKPQKAIYIHEIHNGNIDRLTYLVPMIVNADIVHHFDTNTWFSKTVDEMGLQKIGDRMHKYTLWMNFDDLDRWRQKYLNNKQKGLVSVTRWTSSKNIRRSIDIIDALQKKKPDWQCKVHGVERSRGALDDILLYPLTLYDNGNGKIDDKSGKGTVLVSGPVIRNDGIDIVARHVFSSSFYSEPKKPEDYGNRMEYTQIEIVGAGTIPVFDKHWAQNNHTKNGTAYYDIPYSAIYTDGTDVADVADKLIEISENPELMQKYLDTSYKLVVQEFGADTVIPEAIDKILSVGKNKNQMSTYEICDKFVSTGFADEMKRVEDAGELPVFGIKEFMDGDVKIINEKKELFIKKIRKRPTGGTTKNLF